MISTTVLRTQSDDRLVALARSGHEGAFEAIIDRYSAELGRALRRRMPATLAEDVLQQTHMQAWKALRNGATVRQLRPWLHQIARNAAFQALTRGYDYDELHDALVLSPGPDEDYERTEIIRRALRGIADLPDRQREALLMVAVAGRAHAEVASELGVSDTAVRQLVRRARVTLRAAATAVVPPQLVIWAATQGGATTAGEVATGVGMAGTALKLTIVAVAVGGAATAAPHIGSHIVPNAKAEAPAIARAHAPATASPRVSASATPGTAPAHGSLHKAAGHGSVAAIVSARRVGLRGWGLSPVSDSSYSAGPAPASSTTGAPGTDATSPSPAAAATTPGPPAATTPTAAERRAAMFAAFVAYMKAHQHDGQRTADRPSHSRPTRHPSTAPSRTTTTPSTPSHTTTTSDDPPATTPATTTTDDAPATTTDTTPADPPATTTAGDAATPAS